MTAYMESRLAFH